MEDNKQKNWMYYEKLFAKITLWLLGLSFVFLALTIVFQDQVEKFIDVIMIPILIFYAGSIVIFFLSIIRIIKYSASRTKQVGDTVTKSVLNLLLSPITFLIANILLFMVAISSCSIQ